VAESVDSLALQPKRFAPILAGVGATPRRVVIVIFPDVQLLDVAGPLDVFSMATWLGPAGEQRYTTEIIAPQAGPVRTASALPIVASRSLRGCRGPIDTLVIGGGLGVTEASRDRALVRWIRAAATRARRVASVCSGAFLLAEAGLLDGKRATSHWATCDALRARFPAIKVEDDPIFVRDGAVWTSAGITAGIDLALALVEEDHGSTAALEVARWLVVFLKRPGGQAQFSAQLASQAAERAPLGELQAWITDHPGADLSVPALAKRAGMSVRNFARAFHRELGVTPAVYVERARVEAARRALEESRRSIADIARACGFGTIETLERAFRRTLGVSPRDYRERFQPIPSHQGALS